MKINKTNALHLWNQSFGNAEYVEDFHGNLMCRNAYGDKKYKIPTCTQHLIIKCLSQIVRDI